MIRAWIRSAVSSPIVSIAPLLWLFTVTACSGAAKMLQATDTGDSAEIARYTPAPSVPIPTDTPLPGPTATYTPTPVPTPTPTPTLPPTATPQAACDQPGQIVRGRFPSALASPDLAYRIYLPPCYGQDGRTYPVLYLLPGNIHDDGIWDQLGLDEAAESAIQTGVLPPMLIVMPEGGRIAIETSGGPYSYEGVILNELLPYVESNYCAWSEPAGRAIGGLSRGGYWALEIAFRNPSAFASVGGHGAALVDTYAGPSLDPKFTAATSDLGGLRIYLDAGQNDWYRTQLTVLHDNLVAAGRDHAWIIQEGGHDNSYWSAHVNDYLGWYAEPWSLDRSDYLPCPAADG